MLIDSHILVTGANGFVGRHLGEALRAKGARVSQMVRSVSSDSNAAEAQYAIDLTDRVKVADVISLLQPDYVIHLAGAKSRANDIAQFRDQYNENVLMSLNIIDACRALENFKRLVFLGTCDEYGQAATPYVETQREAPVCAYGLSKLAVTQILSGFFYSHRFPSVVLRPTIIYGPGQGDEMFLPALIRSLLAGKDFPMTAGEQRRDFVFIDDVVDAIIKAVTVDERVNGTVINIGAGISYQIKELAALIAGLIDPAVGGLIKFGAIEYRANEVMNYSVVTSRAKELLGWYPCTRLEDGLEQTVRQFKESTDAQMRHDLDHA